MVTDSALLWISKCKRPLKSPTPTGAVDVNLISHFTLSQCVFCYTQSDSAGSTRLLRPIVNRFRHLYTQDRSRPHLILLFLFSFVSASDRRRRSPPTFFPTRSDEIFTYHLSDCVARV